MSIQTLITVLLCAIFSQRISKKDKKDQYNKIKIKIQEGALRILYNDFSSHYKFILNKSGESTMEVKRLRTLALEVFKTLNNMISEYMKEIFHKSSLDAETS